jgi:pantoate--beta-alanine ligase
MQVITTIAELRTRLNNEPDIAFVPTMGNLHEGHLALMREAQERSSCVVVSIFVNPLQFGPNEDFDQYPRTLEADIEKLHGLASVVFAPSVREMYPVQQTVFVEPPPVANELCGAMRPGHFRGVATVVVRLFNIVRPNFALFGKKDYQQLHIIDQLVTQLNLQIRVIGSETVRAHDGLALSSRNQYLTISERSEAVFLFKTLQAMRQAVLQGARNFGQLEQEAVHALTEKGWSVDYVSIRNQSDLQPIDENTRDMVILAAARLGKTRLLDNIEVSR